MNPLKRFAFWYKFSRFLLISLSALVLLVSSQQINFNPVALAALIGECVDGKTFVGNGIWATTGCTNASIQILSNPVPVPLPLPPPASPQCTPNEVIGTTQHCVDQQKCTFNIQHRQDCSTYEGGAFGCQNSIDCGFNPPPPPPPPPPAQCPVNGACCAAGVPKCNANGKDSSCPAGFQWCYGGFCVNDNYNPATNNCQVTPLSPPPPQACPTQQGQAGTRMYCNGAVFGYDLCTADQYFSDGSVKHYTCRSSVNQNACVGDVTCPAPAAPPASCNSNTTPENSCSGQQMCTFNVTRDCNGNIISRSSPANCQNSSQCGFSQCRSVTCELAPTGCHYINQITYTCNPNVTPTCGNLVCNPGVPIPPAPPAPPIIITNNNPSSSTSSSTSSSSSSNTNNINIVTGAAPAAANTATVLTRYVPVQTFGNVGIGTTQFYANVKQLPKTGLPALAWGVLAFIPAGFKIRKFSQVKKDLENDPTFIWEDRQFQRNGHNL